MRGVIAAVLVLSSCAQQGPDERAVQDFGRWTIADAAASAAARGALERDGEHLARARRATLKALMLEDPRAALELSLPAASIAELPPSVARLVETWRDGTGTLHVINAITEDGAESVERFVTFDDEPGRFYRAGVWGRRLELATTEHLRLHGIVLDDVIALTDGPFRAVAPALGPGSTLFKQGQACERVLSYDVGGSVQSFCGVEAAAAAELAALEEELPPASAWTEGPKTVLYIRVDFSDRAGDPVSQSSAQSTMDANRTFFEKNSYGKTTTTTTFTPTLRLPKTQATYQSDQNSYLTLMSEARQLAKDAGFDTAAYNLDIIAFANTYSGGWAGRGYVGGKGTWLNGYFDLRVVGHELGHNYGNQHANYWSTSTGSPIGTGTSQEYGNGFDMMGSAGNGNTHFNAWFKSRFNWIVPSEVAVAPDAGTGTYRILPLENTLSGAGLHALQVVRDPSRSYWFELRTALTSNTFLRNGLSVNWGYPSNTQSNLLDMTAGDGDKNNSALIVGRTFSDRIAGIHVTPIARGGTTPDWIDVVVNRGTFPGNRPPVVTVTASSLTPAVGQSITLNAAASDPDGDALAFDWNFADGSFGTNESTATKSWSTARAYSVVLTVSDMKGATATASVLITVGTPTTFTLTGTVTAGGSPVSQVRVSDGTRATVTDSLGAYALTGVPAGSYTLTAVKDGYSFTRGFAAPLAVSGSQGGLDFTGTLATYSVSGKVSAGATGIAGVVVTDGTRTATTNASGDYTLTLVPPGRYALTATKAGWAFTVSSTFNPLEVQGGNVTGVNFFASGATLSGTIPTSGVSTAPTVTDGVRSVTATAAGSVWSYSLTYVAAGSWTLTATSPGVNLEPTFTNPVSVVATTPQSGLNFRIAAGVSVSGTITTGGTPLPGVQVSDGTRAATTDAQGRYVITGVPPGTFTLTPTRAPYDFVPATRSITVASTALTGQDFTTTVVNAPPTVATAAAASPSTVTGTTTQLTALGADDTGEAALVYTWASTSGPAAVTFSASGTNSAKSSTATFTRAGTYTLSCTIRDPGGLSVQSSVTVTVSQVATSLTVSPDSATVVTGATRSFSASLRDQFSQVMGAVITWTATGAGTVNASGLFTAGATPGAATVTATASGRSGSASITVQSAGAPTITTAATATPSPVVATTTALSVRATDDGGEPGLTYTWACAGPSAVSLSVNGTNAAKDTVATFAATGTFTCTVTVADGSGNTASSAVTVVVQATPTRLELQPAVVTLSVGQAQQFTASVVDQFGDPVSPAPAVTWALSGGGTVSATGEVRATAAGGPFVLTATAGALGDTSQLTVVLMTDTTAPTVVVTQPSPGATVDPRMRLAADAQDAVGVTQVEFLLDGTVSLGVVSAAPYVLDADAASVAPGPHTLTATAVDAAGNRGTSPAVPITITRPDTAPPAVTITSPAEGSTVSSLFEVAVEASDDVGVASVDFELDGALATTSTAAPWTVTLEAAAGAHTVVAVARDGSGKSTRSAAVQFVVRAGLRPEDLPAVVLGGCGCSGPADASVPWLLALLVALRRRRG